MSKANVKSTALINMTFEFGTDQAAAEAAPAIEKWFKDSGMVQEAQARSEQMRWFPPAEVAGAAAQIGAIVGVTVKVAGGVAAVWKLIKTLKENRPSSRGLVTINVSVGNERIPVERIDEDHASRIATRRSRSAPPRLGVRRKSED